MVSGLVTPAARVVSLAVEAVGSGCDREVSAVILRLRVTWAVSSLVAGSAIHEPPLVLLLSGSQSRYGSRCLNPLVPFNAFSPHRLILERIDAARDIPKALQEASIRRIAASMLFHFHSSEGIVEVMRLVWVQCQDLWLQGLLNLRWVRGGILVAVLHLGRSTWLEVLVLRPREGLGPRRLAQWRLAIE